MINPKENYSGAEGTPIFYTIEEFEDKVITADLMDLDGVGYYANAEKISSVQVKLSEIREDHDNPRTPEDGKMRTRMLNGTHVAWFPYTT